MAGTFARATWVKWDQLSVREDSSLFRAEKDGMRKAGRRPWGRGWREEGSGTPARVADRSSKGAQRDTGDTGEKINANTGRATGIGRQGGRRGQGYGTRKGLVDRAVRYSVTGLQQTGLVEEKIGRVTR